MYVAGAWRFVQCNWGARHLVNAKEVPKQGNKNKNDSIRLVGDSLVSVNAPVRFRVFLNNC